jgi:uncharacterized protein with HEPN domain
MHPSECARINDMIEALSLICHYVDGRDRADLDTDSMLRDALAFRMLVLGEAAKNLSEITRNECGEFPWRSAIRMRDLLAHGYNNVDLDIVWEVAIEQAPKLLPVLEKLLQSLPEQSH